MVVVPAETEVTKPVLLTVAIAGFELVHGFTAAGVPDPVNSEVPPRQIGAFPEIVGFALTVTNCVV